jgi:putative two-component system response regulator
LASLLLVDDDETMLRSTSQLLRRQGHRTVTAENAAQAKNLLESGDTVELVLLDVNMPGESGMELLSHVRTNYPGLPVIMVTGDDDTGLAKTALEIGAYGYVVKPFKLNELLINIANALIRHGLELEMKHKIERLHLEVEQRKEELRATVTRAKLAEEEALESLSETIVSLGRLAEYRSGEPGRRIERLGRYCGLLAGHLGLSPEECEVIEVASRLHDIGQVEVPDEILFAPGKLTEDQLALVRHHTQSGYELLRGSHSEVMRLAATIAWTHHERWDGRGYPRGLSGDAIPPAGRIVAIADVFDALTTRRSDRSAFPVALAKDMMLEDASHFDPQMLGRFFEAMDEVEDILKQYVDSSAHPIAPIAPTRRRLEPQ